MQWKDITHEHNGKKAAVSAKSTPRSPSRGEGPFVGIIVCNGPNLVPVLVCGEEVHSFVWYWDVELLDDDIPDGVSLGMEVEYFADNNKIPLAYWQRLVLLRTFPNPSWEEQPKINFRLGSRR